MKKSILVTLLMATVFNLVALIISLTNVDSPLHKYSLIIGISFLAVTALTAKMTNKFIK
jgi:hypothetical protein